MPFCNGQFYRCYHGEAGASIHPTILLHGLGGAHLSWPPTLRRLKGQQVYALDLPGHGLSELPACISIDSHIACLHRFITDMGFYSVNLIGHSMGSAIAYAYACRHPGRVRKLSLISFGQHFLYADQLESCFANTKTKAEAINLFIEKGFHPGFPKNMRRKILEPLNNTRSSVLFADAHICAIFSPGDLPEVARFPIQLIVGNEDALVPLYSVRQFSAGMAIVPICIIENSGHMVVFEQPEPVRQHLKYFLEQELPIW